MANRLTQLKHSSNPGGEECKDIYNKLLASNSNDITATELLIFTELGSGEAAEYLLSHAYDERSTCLEALRRMRVGTFRLFRVPCFGWFLGAVKVFVYNLIFYLDVIFDVRLILFLHSIDIFEAEKMKYTLVACLVLSEVLKMHLLYTSEGPDLFGLHWLMRVILVPVLPAIMHYQVHKLESKIADLCTVPSRDQSQEEDLTRSRKELQKIRALKAKMRATENAWEHLPQLSFTTWLLTFAFPQDKSRLDPILGLDEGERDDTLIFISFSVLVSALSIVRGQVNLISAQLNGQLSLKAKFTLGSYISLAVLCKSCQFVLCHGLHFTPATGGIMFFSGLSAFVLTSVMSFQIASVYFLQIKLLGAKRPKRGQRFQRACWSLLAPPLFLSWEDLYQQENGRKSIPECWWTTKWNFLANSAHPALGWVVLACVSLVRGSVLQDDCLMPTAALLALLLLATFGAFTSTALGFLYFKKYHPWAGLLRAELLKSNAHAIADITILNLLSCIGLEAWVERTTSISRVVRSTSR